VDRLGRAHAREHAEAAALAFDPQVLTIGFARRVATYKRLELLVRDAPRLLALLEGERPLQIVLAGKAHPRDEEGKHALQALFGVQGRGAGERTVYLDDYDLSSAAELVRGCDVWVNLPRPPLEASGTSGMKSAMNGGLNLSVLDGWWDEADHGVGGWALSGEVDADHAGQDARHSHELMSLLEQQVVPMFYERDAAGRPAAWIAKMRASLMSLGPMFGAGRMLEDYLETVYRAGE
jgi:starch phosphorylase